MITMDYRLIELCRVGDSSAIEHFVQTYQQDIYRLALSILDDSGEAEDAAQEALLAALRALDSFQGDSSLKTWLYSIAVNICRTRLQHHKRRERLAEILGGILRLQTNRMPSVEENTIKNESNESLWRAIHDMDQKHRIPIVLRYYHDLSVAEIANILQIPEGTVHSRLNTARRLLHKVFKEVILCRVLLIIKL
jgi:RNA polymerase sigma-70 factor (ECF subfamily)